MQRRAQIGRRNRRHIGKDRFNLDLADFQRDDGGRQACRERRRDINHLGETGVRVKRIERAESVLPIGERAHERKGWRLPHALHAVGFVDHMAPPAMPQRQCLTLRGVTFEDPLWRRRFGSDLTGKDSGTFRLKPLDRPLANIGQQPVHQGRGTRGVGHRDMPKGIEARKDRHAFGPDDHITTLIDLRDPHTMLERETRQQMLQETRFCDARIGRERKILALRKCGLRQDEKQEKTDEFHSNLSARMDAA